MSPAKAQALLQQALTHHQAGRLPSAAALYAQVRALLPGSFEAHHLGGAAAVQLGNFAEAVELLTRALRFQPKSAATYLCLGLAFASLGKNADALASLRKASELDPKNHEAWSNLASVLVVENRLDDAIAAYERCLRVKPDFAQGWTGLGSVLQLRSRSEEAIEHHTRALKLDPRHPKARFARAQALQGLHRVPEALADFEAHLAQNPSDLEAHSYRLLLLNYLPEITRETLFAEHKRFGHLAATTAKAHSPKPPSPTTVPTPLPNSQLSTLSSQPSPTPSALPNPTTNYQLPTTSARASLATAPQSKIEIQKSKIRLAFLSPDLRAHSVACFLEPLLRHLDPSRFEVILYHDHFITDATSERLRRHARLWRNFIGLPADSVAAQIRADAPDILVDLAGHTGFNRLPLYARRLAPVQISYLGYPNTTGLAAMDHRFTDAIADPTDADAFHTEKLLRFSSVAWSYEPPPDAPAPSAPPSASGAPFTFGSFNSLSKINDATLRLWADILRTVPNSRLLLKSFGLDAQRLHPRLSAAGFDLARVELLPAVHTTAEHLALYARLDIALDPFPYNGTTTTCEALWMGVPTVTLRGDRHAARVGASLLTAVGHPELIASDPSHYIALAARLAADPAALAELRAGLRPAMQRSPLLDHPAQATRFAEALLACWSARVTPAPAAATPGSQLSTLRSQLSARAAAAP